MAKSRRRQARALVRQATRHINKAILEQCELPHERFSVHETARETILRLSAAAAELREVRDLLSPRRSRG